MGLTPYVYLDLDGVGSNWGKYVLANHFPGKTIDDVNQMEAAERADAFAKMYRNDPRLFYKLEPYPPYRVLLAEIAKFPCKRRILTAAGSDHHSYEIVKYDKVRYLGEHFGVPPSEIIVCRESADKKNYADNRSILVDDFHRNCKEWEEEGGFAIRVEQCEYDPLHVVAKIKTLLDEIQSGK